MKTERPRLALVAAATALAMAGTAPAANAARPAKQRTAAPSVARATVPRAPVAQGASVTVSAKAVNRAAKTARVAVSFHLSADRRWDRRDVKLGSASTKRLKRGVGGVARLTAKLPARVKAGSHTLLACTRTGRRAVCAVAGRKLVVKAAVAPAPPAPQLPAPPAPKPPDPPAQQPAAPQPALALQLDDGVEWTDTDDQPDPEDSLTTTLRLGVGLPGAAGYERSTVAPQPPLAGAVSTITSFAVDGDTDDGSFAVELPFAVALGGVRTRSIEVSSNGWLSTTGPATAYNQQFAGDFRGLAAALGANQGLVAPFLSDLEVNGAGNGIDLVEAADGSAVAIRWTVWTLSDSVPVDFQAVLFRDGRIRFDYFSANPLGDDDPATPLGDWTSPSLVGISPGVAGRTALVETDSAPRSLPTQSILFTPLARSAEPAAAGAVAVELPRGTSLEAADPACTLTHAATVLTPGLVTCAAPALDASGAELDVTWKTAPEPLFQLVGNGFQQAARWTAGDASTDGADELQPNFFGIPEEPQVELLANVGGPGEVVLRARGSVLSGDGWLRNARLTLTVPAGATLTGMEFASGAVVDLASLQQICAGLPVPAGGGEVSCRLPSPFMLDATVTIRFGYDAAGQVPTPFALSLAADNLTAGPLGATAATGPPVE